MTSARTKTNAGEKRMAAKASRAVEAAEAVRQAALAFPGAWEDYPWGERVVKVGKKVFVFLGKPSPDDDAVGFSVKLPVTGRYVLEEPWAEPTGYGLGKAGWVSVRLSPDELPALEVMRGWLEESYRAVAPKKLVKALDEAKAPAAKARPSKKRS